MSGPGSRNCIVCMEPTLSRVHGVPICTRFDGQESALDAEHEDARQYVYEAWAERYNDARIGGFSHGDAVTVANASV